MAVVTTKSSQITNRDARPKVLNNSNQGSAGEAMGVFGKAASASGDNTGSKYVLTQIPSGARVSSVRLYSAALGGSAAADIGIYRNTSDGGAVVDADFFGSAVSLVSAVNGTEVSFESGVFSIAKREQPLWQAAGLSSDPLSTFDVVATLTADSAAAGDVGVEVTFFI